MKKYFLLTLFTSLIFNLNITVQGIVVEESGNQLKDVNIYSGTKGTITGNNGYFELSVNNDDLVNISHIGFSIFI